MAIKQRSALWFHPASGETKGTAWRAAGGGTHMQQPPSRLGWFLFLAAAAQARKTGEENKSIRHKDKYASQRLHVAADSSGRAVVAA